MAENNDSTLFAEKTKLFDKQDQKAKTICVFDASGSVIFNKYKGELVHNIMCNKLAGIVPKETKLWTIHWNSDYVTADKQPDRPHFADGIWRPPFPTLVSQLLTQFVFVQKSINSKCLTYPHLAFEELIKSQLVDNITPTRIYFVTDGKIGYNSIPYHEKKQLEDKLAASIKKVFDNHHNVELVIVTIEHHDRDFNNMEGMQDAAGCDVYNVIMKHKLTGYVRQFISFTPNNDNGFIHIDQIQAPPGFVPYGSQYFSEKNMYMFIEYLKIVISETKDENDQLKVVQNLASSLSTLVKDKPKRMVEDITRTFSLLFQETNLDPLFVNYILTTAVENQLQGSANIFAKYRESLHNLYKQANDMLFKSVKDCTNLSTFVTYPMNIAEQHIIVSGPSNQVDKTVVLQNRKKTVSYPQGAIEISGILMPVVPLDRVNTSKMSEQCLRQWTRQIVSTVYGLNVMSDNCIYAVLLDMFRIILSDVDDNVKQSFRYLGHVMLKKKRLNTNMTELERLENGELPTPNSGNINEFFGYMMFVSSQLGIKLQPMTMWYLLCLALDNKKLISHQLIHCHDDIKKDFVGIKESELLDKVKASILEKNSLVTCHKIPLEHTLEYSCPITLSNTANTGGKRILPHLSSVGFGTCSPLYVLSEEGYNMLVNSNVCVCPICYSKLDKHESFVDVVKKPVEEKMNFIPPGIVNIFTGVGVPIAQVEYKQKDGKNRVLLVLKGTVGAGKSTIAQKMKDLIESRGGKCIIEGTDKYCKDGMHTNHAAKKVTQNLRKFTHDINCDNNLMVAIIDTCGERNNGHTFFNVNFNRWTIIDVWPNYNLDNEKGYLAWTLRNVLNRIECSIDCNYYLNPVSAGLNVCVTVHKKKAQSLGLKAHLNVDSNESIETIIAKLDDLADQYTNSLRSVQDEAKYHLGQAKLFGELEGLVSVVV